MYPGGTGPRIDDANGIVEGETAGGDAFAAGTDLGQGKRQRNDDRILVLPARDVVAVFDGFGSDGGTVAESCARTFLASAPDFAGSYRESRTALQQLLAGGLIDDNSGSTFVAGCIRRTPSGDRELLRASSGDSSLFVVRQGTVLSETDQQDLAQMFVRTGHLTPDQALYNQFRHILTHCIDAKDHGDAMAYPPVPLVDGDLVVACSDGVTDTFTPEEIARMLSSGSTLREHILQIASAVRDRARNIVPLDAEVQSGQRARVGRFSDGFLSKPVDDNRSIAIVRIG